MDFDINNAGSSFDWPGTLAKRTAQGHHLVDFQMVDTVILGWVTSRRPGRSLYSSTVHVKGRLYECVGGPLS